MSEALVITAIQILAFVLILVSVWVLTSFWGFLLAAALGALAGSYVYDIRKEPDGSATGSDQG